MPHVLPALIFDLDGTLTDSKPGIVGCLRKVLDDRGMGNQGPLDRFVGPPADEWTVELLPKASQEERDALVRDYRACYDREGWKNNSVFAGVREMLDELHGKGFPLYVCTSKPQHFAVRILDRFALIPLFTAVYGDRTDVADHSKTKLLATLVQEQKLNAKATWMIGDRIFDFRAARANGLRRLGAGWGYGNADELAEAEIVAATPAEVTAWLTGAHAT